MEKSFRPGELYAIYDNDIHLYGEEGARISYLQDGDPIIVIRESRLPWENSASFIHVLTPQGPGDVFKAWIRETEDEEKK